MRPVKLYIASAYSLPVGEEEKNVHRALDAAEAAFRHGFVPFVPILTHYWHLRYPHPYEEWIELDLQFLAFCDVLWRLPGESKGADGEVAWALAHKIDVVGSLSCLLRWRQSPPKWDFAQGYDWRNGDPGYRDAQGGWVKAKCEP